MLRGFIIIKSINYYQKQLKVLEHQFCLAFLLSFRMHTHQMVQNRILSQAPFIFSLSVWCWYHKTRHGTAAVSEFVSVRITPVTNALFLLPNIAAVVCSNALIYLKFDIQLYLLRCRLNTYCRGIDWLSAFSIRSSSQLLILSRSNAHSHQHSRSQYNHIEITANRI